MSYHQRSMEVNAKLSKARESSQMLPNARSCARLSLSVLYISIKFWIKEIPYLKADQIREEY